MNEYMVCLVTFSKKIIKTIYSKTLFILEFKYEKIVLNTKNSHFELLFFLEVCFAFTYTIFKLIIIFSIILKILYKLTQYCTK